MTDVRELPLLDGPLRLEDQVQQCTQTNSNTRQSAVRNSRATVYDKQKNANKGVLIPSTVTVLAFELVGT